ncbi:peptidoglycan DD-metalloendopeptidase family protein [Clostridium sp. CS001]|uniref:peptidoglycan DD-metalloendopeptidase family protein n=1 Tax=Clostridium sp. CS001 TaxID=2880648 RepID=UPI001CF58A25|nr:peptidoglycan DD-metalloendopeptidase family protein [Clostridium sp. CS001]MCB2290676.1 peptidoglycan DD-metalloendopeptidase family protein [Clostridium sp. CS001]
MNALKRNRNNICVILITLLFTATMFMTDDNFKKEILKRFNITVDAFLMKSDNKKLAYVVSEKQGKEVLNSIKDYYSQNAKLNTITEINIDNKITYEFAKIRIGNLYENDEITQSIIKYNSKAQKPIITVRVVGNTIKDQVVKYTTIMKSSDKLMSGASKVQLSGVDGIKKVTNEVIFLNNNLASEKPLKSEIVTPMQSKEILIGTNKPVILDVAYMNTPSRGSISSSFGVRWGKMHKGIDIAANLGATISAALDGTVTYAGWQDGYGNVIKMDHGDKVETTYAHCSAITVKKGEVVNQGEKIGEVGSTGNSTGPHLHFEVRKNGEPINPENYIK